MVQLITMIVEWMAVTALSLVGISLDLDAGCAASHETTSAQEAVFYIETFGPHAHAYEPPAEGSAQPASDCESGAASAVPVLISA